MHHNRWWYRKLRRINLRTYIPFFLKKITYHRGCKYNWRMRTDTGISQFRKCISTRERTNLPPSSTIGIGESNRRVEGMRRNLGDIDAGEAIVQGAFHWKNNDLGWERSFPRQNTHTDETVISIYSTSTILQINNERVEIATRIIPIADIYRTILVRGLSCGTIHRGGAIPAAVLYTVNKNMSAFTLSESGQVALVLNLMPCRHSRSECWNCGKQIWESVHGN